MDFSGGITGSGKRNRSPHVAGLRLLVFLLAMPLLLLLSGCLDIWGIPRGYAVVPSGKGHATRTQVVSPASSPELRDRLKVEAWGYPGDILIHVSICSTAAPPISIDHERMKVINGSGQRACDFSPGQRVSERFPGCERFSFVASYWDSCRHGYGDFHVYWSDAYHHLRLPVILEESNERVMLDYYFFAAASDWDYSGYEAVVGPIPDRRPEGPSPYSDCTDIRFTLAATDLADSVALSSDEVAYSLSLHAESKCPDSLRVEVDRAVILIADTIQINLSLSEPATSNPAERADQFTIPSSIREIRVRLHVGVSYLDGTGPLDGQFWLTQDVLLVPQDVLRTIARLRSR